MSYRFNFTLRDDSNSVLVNKQITVHKRPALGPTKNSSVKSAQTQNLIIYRRKKPTKRENYRNLEKEDSSGGGRLSLSLTLGFNPPFFMVTLCFSRSACLVSNSILLEQSRSKVFENEKSK